jgi:hypothetical protein
MEDTLLTVYFSMLKHNIFKLSKKDCSKEAYRKPVRMQETKIFAHQDIHINGKSFDYREFCRTLGLWKGVLSRHLLSASRVSVIC